MNRLQFLIGPMAVLALVSMACGQFNFPSQQMTTIPTTTASILAGIPSGTADLELKLAFGEVNVQPGATNGLVEGTYTYNLEELEPHVIENGNSIVVRNGQDGNISIGGFPGFSSDTQIESEWNLMLAAHPTNLTFDIGAANTNLQLGGLELINLVLNLGAGNNNLDFGELNGEEMALLDVNAGVGNIVLTNLANANAAQMAIDAGAGEVRLNFSGDLQQDIEVTINAGLGNVTVIVPAGVNAEVVEISSGLGNVSISGDWQHQGNLYSQTGDPNTPTITFRINQGAGNIELRN